MIVWAAPASYLFLSLECWTTSPGCGGGGPKVETNGSNGPKFELIQHKEKKQTTENLSCTIYQEFRFEKGNGSTTIE